MFKKAIGFVLDKLGNISPIKNFFSYIFQRILSNYIDREIKLSDFKNGILQLSDLPLNHAIINKIHLKQSPYKIQEASIGQLSIELPPFQESFSKKIQVRIKNIQIILKQNKIITCSQKQFSEQQDQQSSMQGQEEDTKSQGENLSEQIMGENDESVDNFSRLARIILMNIKVVVESLVIRIYPQTPLNILHAQNQNTTQKPQLYILFRMGKLELENQYEIQQQQLDVKMREISMHLLNESMLIPEFEDEKNSYIQEDYPWKYPTIDHPNTILSLGFRDKFVQLTLKRIKQKTQQNFNVDIIVPQFEFIVEPYQILFLQQFIQYYQEYNETLSVMLNKQKYTEFSEKKKMNQFTKQLNDNKLNQQKIQNDANAESDEGEGMFQNAKQSDKNSKSKGSQDKESAGSSQKKGRKSTQLKDKEKVDLAMQIQNFASSTSQREKLQPLTLSLIHI
eukprot:TRINITY_DN6262_c0_g2_i4.p1 TRINITY_DN6262_c0_g2~~TRINITY_DN6262_c0_g2_i4.p1  ORF type:complete len:451 (+),score=83.19 TRINITY_DN6262_c0_g2_i4:159-1511(+)